MPARAGLVGNPSDGYGGAVLATVLPSLAAEVVARPFPGVRIGTRTWPSIAAWRVHVAERGHGNGARLISAALWTLLDHLEDEAPRAGVAIEWSTHVPRAVGLAGSSALAVGAIDTVAAHWGLALDRRVLAALALRSERDVLGIAAGWQDRVVQSFGRTVLVDAAVTEVVDGVEVPEVREVVTPAVAVPLLVAWSTDAASDSGVYHAPLRARREAVAGPMGDLAALARAAADAWERGAVDEVGAAMDAGWRIRQRHMPLRGDHAALVDVVRSAGLPATTPGSGGSVVALCSDGAAADRVIALLAARGCATCRAVVC